MILVAREDAARVARLLASGQKLLADISVPNHIGGSFTAENVIGELRGSEKPDEFVILGAHLDSWELGTGALDNGCNAAMVIDALRAIKAVRRKAKAIDPLHSVFRRRGGVDRVAQRMRATTGRNWIKRQAW